MPGLKQLERMPFGSAVTDVAEVIAADGAVILTGALTRAQVDIINADLDAPFAALGQGNKADPNNKEMSDFLGYKTKRLPHTLRYSKVWREEYLANPILAEYLAAMVPGAGGSHSYSSSHAIESYPGQDAQPLHRDGEYYLKALGKDHPGGPEMFMLNIFALVDSTEDMGATRVIPGSHLWEDFSTHSLDRPNRGVDETVPACLEAGDLLFYGGRTLHGAGANTTKDKVRRIITNGYLPGFIIGEEAFPFAIPWEEVRDYPEEVQRSMGFRSVSYAGENPGFLWRVETRALEHVLEERAETTAPFLVAAQ